MKSEYLKSPDCKTGTSQEAAMFSVAWVKPLATIMSHADIKLATILLLHVATVLKSETSLGCSNAFSVDDPFAVRFLFSLGGVSDSKVLESRVCTSVSDFSSPASGYLLLTVASK